MSAPTVLVVAKAPVPGLAKTRVARTVGDDSAADLAAAALLDTLDAVRGSDLPAVVALTGDLSEAARSEEIVAALDAVRVVPQEGETFGDRLAQAHLDADAGHGVVQIGMDTPQVTADDLLEATALLERWPSVLGPAEDGGWWLLGVRNGRDASALTSVRMSTSFTGQHTRTVLPHPVGELRRLCDVDTWADAQAVARQAPASRFAAAVRAAEILA
ncbi:TIGR04282 family arsenosugar biosynthesis glycosyltransferase [Aeromicrobium terrae]|uniref:DUF2064 domain-containing protein n=1 Tax=Aeromicrobium terrae TaxID=2498846 RepID=A0A5C8NFY4_9ACTN|nr:DUF2064 domain-containing protein [Aeromicrobium terrae]TXL57669.1 DUF2064 domain-containing protein [Aeromicrobium terrae]